MEADVEEGEGVGRRRVVVAVVVVAESRVRLLALCSRGAAGELLARAASAVLKGSALVRSVCTVNSNACERMIGCSITR